MSNKSQYVLSASLQGHESDVKALTFPYPDKIASASRDGSLRLWTYQGPDSEGTNLWPSQILSHGTPYVNSVAWLESDDLSKYLCIVS